MLLDPQHRVDALFEHPPDDPEQVASALSALEPEVRVAELLRGIELGRVDHANWLPVARALALDALSVATVQRLGRLAVDRDRSALTRACAVQALIESSTGTIADLPMSPFLVEALAIAALSSGAEDAVIGASLATFARGADPAAAISLAAVIEPWRRASGVGVGLWEIRGAVPGIAEQLRRITELGTAELARVAGREEPPSDDAVPGTLLRAWMSAPDGKASFVAVFEVAAPLGHVSVGSVVVRTTEGVRDGSLTLFCTPDDAERAVGEFISALPSLSPSMVEEAVAAVRAAFALDPDQATADAREVLELLPAMARTAPAPVAGSPVDLGTALGWLRRSDVSTAWFLDEEDLGFPPEALVSMTWSDRERVRVADRAVAVRVAALAGAAARWFRRRGDVELAAGFAWLSSDTEAHGQSSVLFRALLHRTAEVFPNEDFSPFPGPKRNGDRPVRWGGAVRRWWRGLGGRPSASTLELGVTVAELMFDVGAPPRMWTARAIEHVMMEVLPEVAPLEAHAAADVCDAALAFAEAAHAAFGIADIEGVRSWLRSPDRRASLAASLADRRRWDFHKALRLLGAQHLGLLLERAEQLGHVMPMIGDES